MGRVIHFELYAEDPERASEFYRRAFGWEITKWEGPMEYWLVMTGEGGPGIDGGISRRAAGETANLVVDVASVDEVTKKIVASGGKVVAPKSAVPGVGWTAYFLDSEGVLFGVMQNDPAAK